MKTMNVYDGCRRHDYQPLGEVCTTLHAMMGTGGGNVPIVLESNQNHATAFDTEICTTLPASMGMGGGYIPMIVESICPGDERHDDPTETVQQRDGT